MMLVYTDYIKIITIFTVLIVGLIALSAEVSAWMTKDYIEEKAKRGSWNKFQEVLNKVPDFEPEDYDKL